MEKEYNDSINSLEETQAKINKMETKKINNKMCQRQWVSFFFYARNFLITILTYNLQCLKSESKLVVHNALPTLLINSILCLIISL